MANISFLVEYFPGGGVERVLMNLAQHLTAKGHTMYLFVRHLTQGDLPEGLPIKYIELPYSARSSRNYDFVVDAIRKHNIEVFFAPGRFPKYLPELRSRGICKLVYVLHGCPFYETMEKWGQIIHPKRRTIGEWLSRWLVNYPKYKLGYYHRKTAKRYRTIYDAVDAYGTLFEEYGRMVTDKLGVRYEESKCVVLQNPIDIPQESTLDTLREKRVLFVGRLSYWDKRIDRLLDVWRLVHADFPDWRLTIAGEGEELHDLQSLVRKYNLPRVEFLGFVADPTPLYASSEILCLTSSIEGCPMVLLEAQLHGCAAIAFDCCSGVREILSPNGECGLFVPNGDIEAYAKALSQLMGNEELRLSIRRNGRLSVERFSPAMSAEQYHGLISRLTKESV